MRVVPLHTSGGRFRGSLLALLAVAAPLAGCANRAVVEGRVRIPSPPASADPVLAAPAQAVIQLVRKEGAGAQGDPLSVRVEMTEGGFRPLVTPVPAGSRVEFRNRDRVFHNAFSLSPAHEFDAGRLAPGESRSIRFAQPGVVNVFCELHPEQEAFVIVAPDRTYVQPNEHGEFSFSGLLGGEYVLKAWHPLHGERSQVLEVNSGSRRRVEIEF